MFLVLAAVSPSAHRKDEYLQAGRLAIEPDDVQLELDLTPGIAVADSVVADIDVDGNASISPGESQRYTSRVLEGISLDLDGTPLSVRLAGSTYPQPDALRSGEGTIRLRLSAAMPRLAPGAHHLRYGNRHRPDIGVYLANALVPASPRIAITDQQRDVDQRTLDVAYVLHTPASGRGRWPAVALISALIGLGVFWLVPNARRQPARQRKTSR